MMLKAFSPSFFRSRTLRIASIRACSTTSSDSKPSEIFRLIAANDIDAALILCSDYAKAVNLTPREFLSKQCSERSYLIYRLSFEARAEALHLAQSGEGFPEGTSAGSLLDENLWHEDVKEQYHRAFNCLNLSRTALKLGSPHPARDYQIIGKSIVHKLLLGRTATVLQTFMSRTLQQSRKPYEWAIANHRKAARLFDEELAPQGPSGPLETPESITHNPATFKSWSDRRITSANAHVRLIVHLISDVSRHVLSREDARAFQNAAEVIFTEEVDDANELKYLKGVITSTRKAL
jgi:hypothetical protein